MIIDEVKFSGITYYQRIIRFGADVEEYLDFTRISVLFYCRVFPSWIKSVSDIIITKLSVPKYYFLKEFLFRKKNVFYFILLTLIYLQL